MVRPHKRYPNAISTIARYFMAVSASDRLLDVADELQRHPDVPVLGVLDEHQRFCGVLERERLFTMIGKPFGRDVFQRSIVKELVAEVPIFDSRTGIYEVAQQLQAFTDTTRDVHYYGLVSHDGEFEGIFSNIDLHEFLSRMTQEDIELAGRLQARLLDQNMIERSDCVVQGWSRPAKGVGGDFYYVQELRNGNVFATLCDVSGKGVAASLVVSLLWGMLRAYEYRRGLRELLIDLNTAIVNTFHLEKYLTGFFCLYEPQKKFLVYADMGHSHSILLRNNHIVRVKSKHTNLPIGVDLSITPHLSGIPLKEGDTLYVYTDGITEQENSEGTEFGENRLFRSLLGARREQKSVCEVVSRAVDQFRGTVPQQDDMSLLYFEYKGL